MGHQALEKGISTHLSSSNQILAQVATRMRQPSHELHFQTSADREKFVDVYTQLFFQKNISLVSMYHLSVSILGCLSLGKHCILLGEKLGITEILGRYWDLCIVVQLHFPNFPPQDSRRFLRWRGHQCMCIVIVLPQALLGWTYTLQKIQILERHIKYNDRVLTTP